MTKTKAGLYIAAVFLNAAALVHKPDVIQGNRPGDRMFMRAEAVTAEKLGNSLGAHIAGALVAEGASVVLLPHEVASFMIEPFRKGPAQ